MEIEDSEEQALEPSDDTWRELFEIGTRGRVLWAMQALRLRRAADLVYETALEGIRRHCELMQSEEWPERGGFSLHAVEPEMADAMLDTTVFDIGHMLMGCAIENAAKAFLITQDPGLVTTEGRLDPSITTHNLHVLLRWCGLDLSARDQQIVAILSECVSWRGRYPYPVKWSQFRRPKEWMRRFAELGPPSNGLVRESAVRLVDQLLGKLQSGAS